MLACSLACLFACFQRFSRPHSFAHSEHQPKECYIESRQLSVPRAQPARTASRPARLEAALASLQRARTKGVRRQPAPQYAARLSVQRERPATKASLPALFQAALVCLQRAPTKGVRRQQKGKGKKRNEEEQEKSERKK